MPRRHSFSLFELHLPPPDDLLDPIPSPRRPLTFEVLILAAKARLHTTDDGTLLLVHRPPTPSLHPTGRAPPADLPPRVYVPMLMRAMGPAHEPHHLPMSLGDHPNTEHAYALLLVDWHGHLHPLVASPLSEVPGT